MLINQNANIKALSWPKYLIWLYTAGIFFSHIFLQITCVLYVFALLFILANRKKIVFRPFHLLIIAFCTSGITAFFISGQPIYKLSQILPFLILLGFVPMSLILNIQKKPDITSWISTAVFFSAAVAIAGAYFHFTGIERTHGFFGGYFTLAALMLFSMLITCGKFLEAAPGWQFLLYPVLLIGQLFVLWWTYTRSAFLGLFAAIGVWFAIKGVQLLQKKVRFTKIILVKLLIISILPVFLGLLIINSSDSRINPFAKATVQRQSTEDLTSGRKGIIDDAIKITSSEFQNGRYGSIIWGHGLNSRNFLVDSPYTSWESDYLQVFMNQGLIGILLMLSIYGVCLKTIISGFKSRQFLINALAAAGLASFTMSFLTLQLTSLNAAAIFSLIYAYLDAFQSTDAVNSDV